MSAPAKLEQRKLCALFSKGHRCPRGRACPLIHKWALYHAAIKERNLAKLNDNYGDAGNKPCTQMENTKPGDSRNGALVPIQNAKEASTSSVAGKKTEQPVKDGQSSKAGKSRGKNRGKKILNVHHSQTVNPADKTIEIGGETKVFKLRKLSPNMFSGQHAVEQTIKGKTLQPLSLCQEVNQDIPRNMGALSINTQRTNSKWPKPSEYGDNYANTPDRRTVKEIEDLNQSNDMASQMVQVRDARMRYYGNICQPPFPYGVTASKPLKQFTLFPELPFEIRLVIWQIAIRFSYNPTLRLLPIRDNNNGAIIFHDLACQSLTPIVLRINHESRTEGLKHYTLSLGGAAYLNKSTGTVFLDSNEPGELTHFVTSVPQHELQTIENLAIRLCEWSWMDETFKEAIWQFTNIKRLAMIFSKSDDSFYLTKSAYKLISQELRKPKESSDEWKVPTICLVSSELVGSFLKSNNFA